MSCDACSFPYSLCQCPGAPERRADARRTAERDPVEREVEEMFQVEPCRAATHGPRNSTCTCEDSRDE